METAIRLRQFGYRPYQTGMIGEQEVEFISFPFEDKGRFFIMARTVVGDPSSMNKFQVPQEAVDLIGITSPFTGLRLVK